MSIIARLLEHLSKLTWLGILLAITVHASAAYMGLWIADEQRLLDDFVYFYMVTSSTVGYGDLSPSSTIGKWLVSLWLIPGGIAIFTALLGKTIAMIQEHVNIVKNGQCDFSKLEGHVVVVGYNPDETNQLFEETRQKLGNTKKVVVTNTAECDADLWVRAQNLIDQNAYTRAGVKTASRVVISLNSDALTVNAIMAVQATVNDLSKKPKIIAYIQNPEQSKLIKKNFPEVEIVTSNRINYLARSMADPGIAEVFDALADSKTAATMFALDYTDYNEYTIDFFERKYECSVVAIRKNNELIFVNNHSNENIVRNTTVYYIRSTRINSARF